MTSTTIRTTSPATTTPHTPHLALHNKSKGAGSERRGGYTSLRKHPQHFLAYSIISILVFLCWLPDFIVALKDVSVTIPQAVKRGSNAMLTCNYDMENDTLYSVKWYKGRREFYRYTPKENPAMKVFLSQNGLNVERNLSNQSHVVLLAVPLNISGKFTCEISVEAPSFQTAMVSGEMEVVELPEEQASVTGIQPRYRIGDLVDGNCSIKYSKPAANLTWTINGIVVPPHHIKTYQIEKFEENNLESVMSAIHFMVTTQHFIKGQMRLKCTASIFDIFKEEIESIIEEDRPRIMASGQSYPPDHGYGTNGESDGYEHNESYLTYFSAPKSSASPTAEFFITKIFKYLQREVVQKFQLSLDGTKTQHIENTLTMTFINDMKRNLKKITQIKMATLATYCTKLLQLMLIKFIITVMVVLLAMMVIQWQKLQRKNPKISTMTTRKESKCNCNERKRNMKLRKQSLRKNLWYEKLFNTKRRQQDLEEQQGEEIGNCYHDANTDDDDCQDKCEQQQEQQHHEQCLVANQNVINEKVFLKDTILTRNTNESFSTTTSSSCDIIDCQQHMSQTLAFTTTTRAIITSATPSLPLLSSLEITAATTSVATTTSATTLGYRKTYVQDSFPLYALDASKSNNAKYMSKDQTLLMTFTTTTSNTDVAVAAATSYLTSSTGSVIAPFTLMSPLSSPATSSSPSLLSSAIALAAATKFKLLQPTSVAKSSSVEAIASPASPSVPYFSRHNYLMAFIGKLLLHQC